MHATSMIHMKCRGISMAVSYKGRPFKGRPFSNEVDTRKIEHATYHRRDFCKGPID